MFAFLTHFIEEDFYKLTTSANKPTPKSFPYSGPFEHLWIYELSDRLAADKFKYHALSGLSRYLPKNQPKIKSSLTTYKGGPIDLAYAVSTFKYESGPTYIYLSKFDDVYKISYSSYKPEEVHTITLKDGTFVHGEVIWTVTHPERTFAEEFCRWVTSNYGTKVKLNPAEYGFAVGFQAEDISKDTIKAAHKLSKEQRVEQVKKALVVEEF